MASREENLSANNSPTLEKSKSKQSLGKSEGKSIHEKMKWIKQKNESKKENDQAKEKGVKMEEEGEKTDEKDNRDFFHRLNECVQRSASKSSYRKSGKLATFNEDFMPYLGSFDKTDSPESIAERISTMGVILLDEATNLLSKLEPDRNPLKVSAAVKNILDLIELIDDLEDEGAVDDLRYKEKLEEIRIGLCDMGSRLDSSNTRFDSSLEARPGVHGLKSVMLAIRTMESKVQALGNELERLQHFPSAKFYNSLLQNAEILSNIGRDIQAQALKLKEENERTNVPDWAKMRELEKEKIANLIAEVQNIIQQLKHEEMIDMVKSAPEDADVNLYPSTLRTSLIDADDPAVLGKFLSNCPLFVDIRYLVGIFVGRYEDFFQNLRETIVYRRNNVVFEEERAQLMQQGSTLIKIFKALRTQLFYMKESDQPIDTIHFNNSKKEMKHKIDKFIRRLEDTETILEMGRDLPPWWRERLVEMQPAESFDLMPSNKRKSASKKKKTSEQEWTLGFKMPEEPIRKREEMKKFGVVDTKVAITIPFLNTFSRLKADIRLTELDEFARHYDTVVNTLKQKVEELIQNVHIAKDRVHPTEAEEQTSMLNTNISKSDAIYGKEGNGVGGAGERGRGGEGREANSYREPISTNQWIESQWLDNCQRLYGYSGMFVVDDEDDRGERISDRGELMNDKNAEDNDNSGNDENGNVSARKRRNKSHDTMNTKTRFMARKSSKKPADDTNTNEFSSVLKCVEMDTKDERVKQQLIKEDLEDMCVDIDAIRNAAKEISSHINPKEESEYEDEEEVEAKLDEIMSRIERTDLNFDQCVAMLDAMQDDDDISISMDFLQDEVDCETDDDSMLSLDIDDEDIPRSLVPTASDTSGRHTGVGSRAGSRVGEIKASLIDFVDDEGGARSKIFSMARKRSKAKGETILDEVNLPPGAGRPETVDPRAPIPRPSGPSGQGLQGAQATPSSDSLDGGDIQSRGSELGSDEASWRSWRRVDIKGARTLVVDTKIRKCQVVKDFEAEHPTDLSVKAGELLDVIEVRPDGWWLCSRPAEAYNFNQNRGDDDRGYYASGYIPGTYVNVVHPDDSRIPFYEEMERKERAEYESGMGKGEAVPSDCGCGDKTHMQVWIPWWFVEQKLRGKEGEAIERELNSEGGALLTIPSDSFSVEVTRQNSVPSTPDEGSLAIGGRQNKIFPKKEVNGRLIQPVVKRASAEGYNDNRDSSDADESTAPFYVETSWDSRHARSKFSKFKAFLKRKTSL